MPRTILLAGATGTIGQAVARALLADGMRVVAPIRKDTQATLRDIDYRLCDVTDKAALNQALGKTRVDALISCLASRTGAPKDAWAIDQSAQETLLSAALARDCKHAILLSAICVQKPQLAFHHAKLAYESHLKAHAPIWTIVRPTAFFKSLSGQLNRLRDGKPFLVFGDGRETACKPISDRDLARFIADCLDDPARHNVVLPNGGPGTALTPLDQGTLLFEALGMTPHFRHVPFALMDCIIGALSLGGIVSPNLRAKADLARIGRFYARESMLVWNEAAARYDAKATPETGQDTLKDHYAALARGEISVDLREHAVF